MPWHIGIDEAGYGPNLGPFVMTLTACHVPDELLEANLWDVLRKCTRRAEESTDHRLIVADSKQVYSTSHGWDALEKTVLSAHRGGFCAHADGNTNGSAGGSVRAGTLRTLLDHLALAELTSLSEEIWFAGDTTVPTEVKADDLEAGVEHWRQGCREAGVTWGFCQSVIVPTPRFNDLIERWDSKAVVLGIGLAQLIQRCVEKTPSQSLFFVIDKHGGRNHYSALLQNAFSDGMVLAQEEGRARSVYRVEGLDRLVRITIMPKADVECFTVALASMISKYLRELLMREFNRFWQTHVPGLKATAGYPLDAGRYFEAIRPAMLKLGLAERQVWRSR